jgi:IMP dehydrogenase
MITIKEALTFDDVSIVPGFSTITSRNNVKLNTKFTRNYDIAVPLVAAPMDTVCGPEMVNALMRHGATGCLHRFLSVDDQSGMISRLAAIVEFYSDKNYPLVATIGATGDFEHRAERSLEAGANVLLIDVAHGDHVHVRRALDWLNRLSNRSKFDVIAGNLATAAAARRLEDWGADALRVGIGGGSMCETRVRTGIGIPQFSTVLEVAEVATVPVISDGGIRYPGDVAKALAAGADSVMVGSLFAGTDEAPGEIFVAGQWPNTKVMKMFRGSASATAKMSVNGNTDHVEGASRIVESKGPVAKILSEIVQGVQSSLSYVGAENLSQFRSNASFVRITQAGLIEAHPHGLKG